MNIDESAICYISMDSFLQAQALQTNGKLYQISESFFELSTFFFFFFFLIIVALGLYRRGRGGICADQSAF